jgi:hypothetical protein
MSYYVKIERLTRYDRVFLGLWLQESGVKEVDYHEGGWADQCIYNVHPHLKFEQQGDAIAYILKHGGEITQKIPEKVPDIGD